MSARRGTAKRLRPMPMAACAAAPVAIIRFASATSKITPSPASRTPAPPLRNFMLGRRPAPEGPPHRAGPAASCGSSTATAWAVLRLTARTGLAALRKIGRHQLSGPRSCKCPKISQGRRYTERGANRMLPAPQFELGTRGGVGIGLRNGLEFAIGWHHAQQRVGPICKNEGGSNDPSPILAHPGRKQSKGAGRGSEARLHCVAGVITGLPLRKQVLVIELQASGPLGLVDV